MIGLTAFSSLPLQLVTLLGGIFLLCAILFSVYALMMYFTGLALAGFTTVIILELTIGGLLMISLGIIGRISRKFIRKLNTGLVTWLLRSSKVTAVVRNVDVRATL